MAIFLGCFSFRIRTFHHTSVSLEYSPMGDDRSYCASSHHMVPVAFKDPNWLSIDSCLLGWEVFQQYYEFSCPVGNSSWTCHPLRQEFLRWVPMELPRAYLLHFYFSIVSGYSFFWLNDTLRKGSLGAGAYDIISCTLQFHAINMVTWHPQTMILQMGTVRVLKTEFGL